MVDENSPPDDSFSWEVSEMERGGRGKMVPLIIYNVSSSSTEFCLRTFSATSANQQLQGVNSKLCPLSHPLLI